MLWSSRHGNLWFTEETANKIGRISPSGTIKEFPKTPTWSEIEQLRRQFMRETGVFYPRSQQLEEGLKREQEEEHKS